MPLPALRPGWLLVSNRYSLISAGTETVARLLGLGKLNADGRVLKEALVEQ